MTGESVLDRTSVAESLPAALTVAEAADLLDARTISPVELLDLFLSTVI